MPSVDEGLMTQQTQLAADLRAGLNMLSLNQTITFTRYVRVVLPIDGFVFLVKAELLSPSALFNSSLFNSVDYNAAPKVLTAANFITAQGSLHYATETAQEEDSSLAINRVIFTSEVPVQDLEAIAPNEIYVGEFQNLKFAFSSRGSFYKQANLYHYVGNAVYSTMQTQIIDNPLQLDTRNAVVSNSLPFWLALNGYTSVAGIATSTLQLFPSFLVPDNIAPPFASVHIEPSETVALQATPLIGPDGSHYQLTRDRVRITTFGVRNNAIQDFVDSVNQYSLDTDNIGLMNMPIVRDEKKTQSEMNILAEKKSIEYEVSYYQTRARTVARQFILDVIPSFVIAA